MTLRSITKPHSSSNTFIMATEEEVLAAFAAGEVACAAPAAKRYASAPINYKALQDARTYRAATPVHHQLVVRGPINYKEESASTLAVITTVEEEEGEGEEEEASAAPKKKEAPWSALECALVAPVPIPPEKRLTPSDMYERMVIFKTMKEADAIRDAKQGSADWLKYRTYRLTASVFGSAVGMSPYQTPDELLLDKVWNVFQGNDATRWGNANEPRAREAFDAWIRAKLLNEYEALGWNKEKITKAFSQFKHWEEGLLTFPGCPWIGVSPDGLVTYVNPDTGAVQTDLIEYKCPYYLASSVDHPYAKYPRNTPPQYFAQVQGVSNYLNLFSEGRYTVSRIWFVVWQPHQLWITEHEVDKRFFAEDMFSKMKAWYFGKFLPAMTHKHNGMLAMGEVSPQTTIVVKEK